MAKSAVGVAKVAGLTGSTTEPQYSAVQNRLVQ